MLSYADWMPMHLVGGGILNALFNFIKPHETVKIKYRLQDCDGDPLRGRLFAPFATLGHLNVTRAPQTDDNGELDLEFIAGNKSGTAQ
ncbi:MAG: hypothetical protein PVH87_28255 [Desulfobacteraceae bacterium]|jgi:hypothetical protein